MKDALAHITHWKADVIRKIKKQPIPVEGKGLSWTDHSAQDVLAWHRQVQEYVLAALQDAPEVWFRDRNRRPKLAFDLDVHCSNHHVKDIEHAPKKSAE